MMMLKDNFLSISRFMDYCRKDMVESWRTNLLRVAMMFGVMVVIFVWTGYFQYQYKYELDPLVRISLYVFLWMGLVCGCLAASFTMEKMKSKTGRLSILMTPATSFEKFFSRWLISTIVYLVVFLVAFKLADYTRVLIYSLAYPDKTVAVSEFKYLFATDGDYALARYIDITKKGLVLAGYFFIQSCFVLGSSIWPKNSFIKTFVAGFCVIVIYGLIFGGIGKLLFDNVSGSAPENDPSEDIMKGGAYVIAIFFTLLNWVLAYYRFKEAEIINRL